MREGDVIVQFGETSVATVGDIYAGRRKVDPGATVTLGLPCGGDTTRAQVTLGTLSR